MLKVVKIGGKELEILEREQANPRLLVVAWRNFQTTKGLPLGGLKPKNTQRACQLLTSAGKVEPAPELRGSSERFASAFGD